MYLYVGAAAIALYLLYRWYEGRSGESTASTGSGGSPSDQTAADTSGLETQAAEGADVSGLQSQESGDVSSLTQGLTQASAQEQSDVASLTSTQNTLGGQLSQLTTSFGDFTANLGSEIAPYLPAAAGGSGLTAAQRRRLNRASAGLAQADRKIKTLTQHEKTLQRQIASGHTPANHRAGKAGGSVAQPNHQAKPRKTVRQAEPKPVVASHEHPSRRR
jgi:hypothetical protein